MELWLIFILISAVLGSIGLLFKKKALKKEHTSEYLSAFKILELSFMLVFAPFIVFKIPIQIVAFIFLISLTTAVALTYIARSYRHTDLSVVAPLSNLTPLFLVILAFFLLGEHVSSKHLMGIGLLLFGTYYLEAEHHAGHWLSPVTNLFKTKNIGFLFFGFFLSAVIAMGEKFIIDSISPFTLLFYHYSFQTFFFIAITVFFYGGFKDIIHAYKTSGKWILGNAIFANLSNLAYFFAISFTFVSLAAPVKKLSTLFTVVLSGRFFKEERIFHKALACCIMLAGVFVIAI
ncbi:EamA family transporter [Candidatus Woesearchaeota archaeon]|nr:EamA family transporter [Candidatus Woesearchaeota archaeon]MBW3006028.1 EamA family transporter [Candidatus Woesearchaeota archaeon]